MQQQLFPTAPLFHGGELAKGKRKSARPLAKKRPVHLVLKAKNNLYKHRALIKEQVNRQSENFSIRLYDVAVAKDHLHLLIKIPSRNEYVKFIRALTGVLARKLGHALWALPPFTRVISWGRDFLYLKRKYFPKNREEATGTRPYEPRKNWYQRFLQPSKSRKRPQ